MQKNGKRLRVLTMNIWFDLYEQDRRLAGLMDVLAALSPDIIALQEMTLPVLRQLAGDPRFADYWFSDRDGRTFDHYGVVVLSREEPSAFHLHLLTSTMDRMLVDVQWATPAGTLQLGAVHLESMKQMGRYRLTQLAEVAAPLRVGDWTLLVGDFNFCHNDPENEALPDGFHDLWPFLQPDRPGWTEDTDINAMRLQHTGRHKQVRYDRVLFAPRKAGLIPGDIQLVGDQALDECLFISDHFGLVADLTWD